MMFSELTTEQKRQLSVKMTHDSRVAQGTKCDAQPRRSAVCSTCNPNNPTAIAPKMEI